MRLLLDSHVFLWWLTDDARLTSPVRQAIANASSVVHVSAATCWELAIKIRLGRLDVCGADLVEEIPANGFVELPISARHGVRAGELPRHHDDPFDRMLVAQAQAEDLTVVTHDPALQKYEVRILAT